MTHRLDGMPTPADEIQFTIEVGTFIHDWCTKHQLDAAGIVWLQADLLARTICALAKTDEHKVQGLNHVIAILKFRIAKSPPTAAIDALIDALHSEKPTSH